MHILFYFFRAAHATYGSSQGRGWIGAAAARLHHSHTTCYLSCVCNLHHSSWQHWILYPLSEARDRSCVLMDTIQIHFHWATKETPTTFELKKKEKRKTPTHHISIIFTFIYLFLGLYQWYVEVPKLGGKWELQLSVYTTATATLDLSHISSW